MSVGAAHRSNIREWYCDHAPRPNTWTLNIALLGQFHPRRDFLSERSPLSRQCGAFATYRRVRRLLASTICRCIAAQDRMVGAGRPQPHDRADVMVRWRGRADVLPIRAWRRSEPGARTE